MTWRYSARRRATTVTDWLCIARASMPPSPPAPRACESSSERRRPPTRASHTPVGDERAVLLSSMWTSLTRDPLPRTSVEPMRDRHVARLCRSCQAPIARQEDSCWRCGAQWASEDVPPTTLRAIAGGLLAYPVAQLG